MPMKDEVRAMLEGANRKQIAEQLGVSTPLLSQWSTGESLPTEPYLARMIESSLRIPDTAKEGELLRLLLILWQERIDRENEVDKEKHKEDSRWTESSLKLTRRALELARSSTTAKARGVKSTGRTLRDFPESFYPLAIISGDKREDSESRITAGDFGAVSPSHAELRWLCDLGLRKDVELYGDKVFILESTEELKERFGRKNLLVVGSPASNHLARRCLLYPSRRDWHPAAPIFRFNLPQYTLQKIEKFLESLAGLRTKQLVGKRADEDTERAMKNWLHYLFTGGILDPTHTHYWVRGLDLPPNRDYGLITLARNPFSDDPSFICIMVAGFHLLGTAHALRMLSNPADMFKRHPLGGVIKISIDTGLPFAKRFDDSTAEWDDKSGYDLDELKERLKKMHVDLGVTPTLNVKPEELDECLTFLNSL